MTAGVYVIQIRLENAIRQVRDYQIAALRCACCITKVVASMQMVGSHDCLLVRSYCLVRKQLYQHVLMEKVGRFVLLMMVIVDRVRPRFRYSWTSSSWQHLVRTECRTASTRSSPGIGKCRTRWPTFASSTPTPTPVSAP